MSFLGRTPSNAPLTSADIPDNIITSAKIGVDVIVAEDIAANAITVSEIQDNAVTLAKMAGGTDGNIISYDASGDPVAIATGSDGQVLTSTGAGSPPAFETAATSGNNTNATLSAFLLCGFTGSNNTYGSTQDLTNWNTPIYDQGSNLLSNGVFTAPKTGKYWFGFNIRLNSSGSGDNNQISLITSNRTYSQYFLQAVRGAAWAFGTLSVLADMDTSDTAKLAYYNANGEIATVASGSFFSGYFVC